MIKHSIVLLNDLLEQDGEEITKSILNTFECYNNRDVDKFLKEKAIIFDRQNLSRTHLVFTSYKGEMVLVAYYALAMKNFVVKNTSHKVNTERRISKTLKKRIAKFAQFDKDTNQYVISAPLIGQLAKNDRYKDLITGNVLLQYACDTVKKVQSLVGGKFVYLECEDIPFLIDFYSSNGFVNFGKRYLEFDEKDDLNGTYLLQMLKYLR